MAAWARVLACLLGLVILLAVTAPSSLALAPQQQTAAWPLPERLPGSSDLADTPYLVVDPSQAVHAFFSQPSSPDSADLAVFYSRWTEEDGWSRPVDIMLPPAGYVADVRGVTLDKHGTLHMLFHGDQAPWGNLYYSSAPVAEAAQARAWTQPQLIAEGAIANVSTAAILGDGDKSLVVVYNGAVDGSGLYSTSSLDGGITWSEPVDVFLVPEAKTYMYDLEATMDDKGQVEVVWTINGEFGSGKTIYFARLDPDGITWSDPIVLAEVGQYDYRLVNNEVNSRVEWPSITAYDGTLYAMYIACEPCERRIRQSTDGGETWTDPAEPFRTRGSYGWSNFTVDSSNTLHMFLSDRARGTNMWHSTLVDGQWQEPEPLIPQKRQLTPGPDQLVPAWPRAVVSGGNRLLVTWSQDPGVPQKGILYSVKTLDAPEVPAAPLPTPPPPAAPLPTPPPPAAPLPTPPPPAAPTPTPAILAVAPLPTPSPLPTVNYTGNGEVSSASTSRQSSALLLLGLAPTALLVSVVLLTRRSARRTRRPKRQL